MVSIPLQGKAGGRTGLALQGSVVQGKIGQGLQVQGRTYIVVSQRRLTVSNIKISCPCSLSKVPTYCVMALKNDA